MTPAARPHGTATADALIVAHYHREGLLRSDTVAALARMQECFDKIILVSTNLADGESRKLGAHGS